MQFSAAIVACVLCGQQWRASDPRVLHRPHDGRWWCTDQAECHERHLANLAAMDRALNQVWDVLDTLAGLEAEGWRFV